ncbi:MAG: NAD(P)-dependent alcohol dehydrogenase [Deltaproteobacteria bacterium]|nr:NAD(P)-dependent alcohol dehydrogenase [Deltaproteobacteria bacterium]
MQAIAFPHQLALDDLSLVDRPVPSPGPHEVVVRILAVSLNYRDLVIARGRYGAYPLPFTPGSDAAGAVAQVGPGVTRAAVGDRVCLHYVPDWIDGPPRAEVAARRLGGTAPGVLATYVCIDERAVVRAPAHLTAIEASTLPIAGVTAWQALIADGGLRPGDTVAVSGTGGVSLFVVQVARLAGARAIVVGRDPVRLARVAAMGAIAIAAEGDWAARVRDASAGGVDLFVDVVGGDALARSIAATRVGGTVAAVGFVTGTAATVDLLEMIRRTVTVRAASGGSRASFEALVRALEVADVHPVVDRVFGFSAAEVRAAYAHLADGRPFGKIVIDLAPGLGGAS